MKISLPVLRRLAASFWRSWLRDVLIVAVTLFAARSAIADWNYVPSGSMKPTILAGDVIFVDRMAYDLKLPFTTVHLAKWDDPKPGNIVVLYSPADGMRLVKRVVGVPGDVVAMRNDVLYINGHKLSYGPAPARAGHNLSARERADYRFETENLEGDRHLIMTYKGFATLRNFGPVKVPDGKYIVMGDNRDNSADSRVFGFANRKDILGRVSAVIVSWNQDRYYLPRSHRFFKPIH